MTAHPILPHAGELHLEPAEPGASRAAGVSPTEPAPSSIAPGQRFDTAFERGCVAVTAPDSCGSFDALDSDGVLCSFSVQMVVGAPVRT